VKAKEKSNKAQPLWYELNSALLVATAILKATSKKDKRFQILQWMFENLHEFNSLQNQHIIDGSPFEPGQHPFQQLALIYDHTT
jgi:hypothetical protein